MTDDLIIAMLGILIGIALTNARKIAKVQAIVDAMHKFNGYHKSKPNT